MLSEQIILPVKHFEVLPDKSPFGCITPPKHHLYYQVWLKMCIAVTTFARVYKLRLYHATIRR